MRQEFFALSELLFFTASNPHSNTKAFCRLGFLDPAATHALALLLNSKETTFELLIDSDAIRHTLAQHGSAKSQLEAMRGQVPIVEADLLALASWLPVATSFRAGQIKLGKQPRVEVEKAEASGTSVVILEWRPGRRQVALVTMYKKRPAA